ncbi:MAG: aminotransferase class V-fold PLP-dependent enzyme, partial [Candidatus Omnitrophota bacterium]|nr:aminotransferase class V-fold PLP-dependent enzyme [Candidatus Omnitrophota bacterium]
MKKTYLMTPGPTPVPPKALLAMAEPIIHHRTPEFMEIFKEVCADLKYIFQTQSDVIVFTSSGTGAMEAAVANLLSPGDKAICVQGGKFGERWTELCNAYGVNAIVIDVEWGKAVDPKIIEQELKKDSGIQAVFTTLCETSTGVLTDIKAIANITKN